MAMSYYLKKKEESRKRALGFASLMRKTPFVSLNENQSPEQAILEAIAADSLKRIITGLWGCCACSKNASNPERILTVMLRDKKGPTTAGHYLYTEFEGWLTKNGYIIKKSTANTLNGVDFTTYLSKLPQNIRRTMLRSSDSSVRFQLCFLQEVVCKETELTHE